MRVDLSPAEDELFRNQEKECASVAREVANLEASSRSRMVHCLTMIAKSHKLEPAVIPAAAKLVVDPKTGARRFEWPDPKPEAPEEPPAEPKAKAETPVQPTPKPPKGKPKPAKPPKGKKKAPRRRPRKKR